jgi:hypothetical protein
MRHIPTFEDFLNEAAAVKVILTPDMFDEDKSTWGIYRDAKETGNTTFKINSNLFVDSDNDVNPNERNVVMFSVSVWPDGTGYVKIGTTNSLKKEPSSTFGKNYPLNVKEFESNSKKISTEIAKFLVDADHFKWINKDIVSDKKPLRVTPKGDFSSVIEDLIKTAIK